MQVKLTIGMPVYQHVCIETALSLLSVQKRMHNVEFNFSKGCYLHEQRNKIFEDAISGDSTHLMFVDCDIVFPPDGIERLLSRDKDIISGNYFTKSIPSVMTAKPFDKDGEVVNGSFELPGEPFKCAAVPAGFLLMRLDAVKDMKKPFDFARTKDGSFIGEDIYFSLKAREKGLEVWCDPTIELKHIGDYHY
jgi:choline kinase